MLQSLASSPAAERVLLFSLGMPLRSCDQPRLAWYGTVFLSGAGLVVATALIINFILTDETEKYPTFKQFMEITVVMSICYLLFLAFTAYAFLFSRRQLYRSDSDVASAATIKRAMLEYRSYLKGYLLVGCAGILIVLVITGTNPNNTSYDDVGRLHGLMILNLVGNSPLDAFVVLLSVITQQQVDGIRALRALAEAHSLTREAYLERQAIISRTSERWSRPLSVAVGCSHAALGIFLIMVCLLVDVSYSYAGVAAGCFFALFSKWLILSVR
jgi:hypothetical protein